MGRPAKIDLSELEQLLNKGETKTDIAKHMDVSPSAISLAVRKIGQQKSMLPRGSNHKNWKGGEYQTANGYIKIYLPEHPRSDSHGYVYKHIVIWEKANGTLPLNWCVHHINGVKNDSDLDNLIAYPLEQHRNLIPYLMQRIIALSKENKELRQSLQKLKSGVMLR